jgi:hypothetical protein
MFVNIDTCHFPQGIRFVLAPVDEQFDICYITAVIRCKTLRLIVGISDYTNLQKLDFYKNDGKEVYEVVTSLGYEISPMTAAISQVLTYRHTASKEQSHILL